MRAVVRWCWRLVVYGVLGTLLAFAVRAVVRRPRARPAGATVAVQPPVAPAPAAAEPEPDPVPDRGSDPQTLSIPPLPLLGAEPDGEGDHDPVLPTTAPRGVFARWSTRAILYGVLGAGTALALAVVIPFTLGMRSYTVMSGSMEPAINTGDVVVERNLSPEQMRPGDVVSFRDPTRANRLITHRVRQVSINAGVVHVITRGDANTGVERWSIPARGRVGLVVYRLPRVGYVAHFVGGTTGHLLFVVLPVLLIGLTLLFDVWRPKRREDLAGAVVAEVPS